MAIVMTALAKNNLTVDEFLDWALGQTGRFELFRGEIVAMSPETVGHARVKGTVYAAFLSALRKNRVQCHALPDGMTVRIDHETAFEPDALIYCGEQLSESAIEVPAPVIVVEVLSPSTRRIDVSLKLVGYFSLPSVMHYLIVDPKQTLIIHHARGSDGGILTHIIKDGMITLDPPGIELAAADIYGH
jgi:Uma2 family endonuclease